MTEVKINDHKKLLKELQRLRAENRALRLSGYSKQSSCLESAQDLNGVSNVVYIKSLDGRYLQVNQRFEEVTNKTAKDIFGKTDSEIFDNENIESFKLTDETVKTLREEIEFEELIPQNGELHTYITQKIPLFNEAGDLYAICGISTDISEREKILEDLLQSRRQHEEAQRLARLGHWYLDIKKNELDWSPEIFRIFEIDHKKFSASYEGFLNAIHPEDRELVNQVYQDSVTQKKPYDITHRLLMKDGSVKYVHERAETLYDYDGEPY